MTDLTPILDEIEGLLGKATKEPWVLTQGGWYIETRLDSIASVDIECTASEAVANAELMVSLKKHAPTLIADAREREQLKADTKSLRSLVDEELVRERDELREALTNAKLIFECMSLACTLPTDGFQHATRKRADEGAAICNQALTPKEADDG